MVGCGATANTEKKETSIYLGMEFAKAKQILKESKAISINMQMKNQTDTDIIEGYMLKNGKELVILISKKSNLISKLEMRKLPPKCKSEQIWISLKTVNTNPTSEEENKE